MEVVGNRHAEAEDQHVAVCVCLQELFRVSFSQGVEGSGEVWGIGFEESCVWAGVYGVLDVVLVDA